MKFLKEKKGVIISFIIGVIIASSITVYATGYFANQITYKNSKTVEEALNELYSRRQHINFDNTYLQSGTCVANCTITSNNVNSTAGLSITGNTNNAAVTDNRWEKSIDMTNMGVLTFYAKKGTDHGGIYIYIDDEIIYRHRYPEFGTWDWEPYYVDISGYQGTHKLTIGGGYSDDTGNTNSNTQYCDIRIYYN